MNDLRNRQTKEELLNGAQLSYAPVILALSNKRQHALDVDSVIFREIKIEESSVVAELLNSEQTEYAHIKAYSDKSKFNVFALGNKFISNIDADINLQTLYNKVLRLYSIAYDHDGLLGYGGNNGLLQSNSDNYIANASVAIPAATGDGFNQISALVKLITQLKLQVSATTASTNLLVYVYGQDLQLALGQISASTGVSVGNIIKSSIKATFIDVPLLALEASAGNGFCVVSDDSVSLDYTIEPTVRGDGINEENGYYWANFARGSLQVTPEVKGAIINQPITFA